VDSWHRPTRYGNDPRMMTVVKAYVNHGRWVVDCPREFCPTAHQVDTPGLFACENCGATGEVEFPSYRRDVERVLGMRPVPQTRNWVPGETVDELLVENVTFGVSV